MIASSQQPRLPPLWTAVILRRRTSAGWFRALAMQSGSSLLQWLEDLRLISPIWDNAKVTVNNHKNVYYYAKPSWKDLSMHKGILNPNSSPLVKRIVCTTKTFSALSKTGLWFVEGGDVWEFQGMITCVLLSELRATALVTCIWKTKRAEVIYSSDLCKVQTGIKIKGFIVFTKTRLVC